ncbi:MAG: hypothetical protein HeimC3_33270 [Candidatus Heimdallarchaeota archaeon LC_3]|nr:MAG: hypothetical protein HeimC3_33270 [Candidatus Heimdallarchaeota archaeon LC_3]
MDKEISSHDLEIVEEIVQLNNLSISSKELLRKGMIEALNGHVIQLNLTGLKISHLPDSIGLFSELKYLFLSNNNLSFLPDSIGLLSKLKVLFLLNNNLTELPESFENLKFLRELDLMANKFRNFPKSICSLNSLEILNLDNNIIQRIPECIGDLIHLKQIDFFDNKINYLPNSIGKLEELTGLNLAYNFLSDIPETVEKLSKLKTLYLNNNQIQKLPEELGNLENLENIYLNNNSLTSLSINNWKLISKTTNISIDNNNWNSRKFLMVLSALENNNSTNFPETAQISANPLSENVFVSKLDEDGANLLFSSILGGNGVDRGQGIKVDGNNNTYVIGETLSTEGYNNN